MFAMRLNFAALLVTAVLHAPLAQASAPSCLLTIAPSASLNCAPIARFDERLSVITNATKDAAKKKELVKALASEDVRRTLLQLQALAKLYESSDSSKSDIKKIVAFRTEIKDIEGALGNFMREIELYERTRDGGGSAELLVAIEKRVITKRKELADYLKKENWLPDPSIEVAALDRSLSKIEFRGPQKDRKILLQSFINRVDEAREALKNLAPYFKAEHFDEADLENGVHSLRRSLRWVTTMMQSADGVFAYSPARPQSREEVDLQAAYSSSKYVKLAPGGTVAIDPITMMQVAKLVAELGELKDFKESQLDLAHVLVEDGFEKSQKKAEASAEKIMTAKFGERHVEQEARDLYAFYLKNDPLKALSRQLRMRLAEM